MEKNVLEMAAKERLQLIIEALGISQREFNRVIGMSESYVSSLRNDITLGVVTKISTAYPQINLEWLVRGEGEILRETTGEASLCDYLIKENKELKAENKELIKQLGRLEGLTSSSMSNYQLASDDGPKYGNVLGQNSDK